MTTEEKAYFAQIKERLHERFEDKLINEVTSHSALSKLLEPGDVTQLLREIKEDYVIDFKIDHVKTVLQLVQNIIQGKASR